jgi:hypothetical protein
MKLIPKNVARDSIGRWHPITLLSITNKIMAKTVVLQVREVARKIVHKEQTGLVQRCFIPTFNHHWRAEEVGSKAHSCLFLIFSRVLN